MMKKCLMVALVAPILSCVSDGPTALDKLTEKPKIVLGANPVTGHLQDVWYDGGNTLYWAHTGELYRTDLEGRVLAKANVEGHHAGLQARDGRLFVAVCPMQNTTGGRTTPECRVTIGEYDAETLKLVKMHRTDICDRSGSLAILDDGTFLVGCLRPGDIKPTQVRFHHLDRDFKLIRSYVLDDVPVMLGIEVIRRRGDEFFLGVYGRDRAGRRLYFDTIVLGPDFRERRRLRLGGAMGLVFGKESVWTASSRLDKNTNAYVSCLRRADPMPDLGRPAAVAPRTVDVRTVDELFAARDALRKNKPDDAVDVRLAPGVYCMEKTFELTADDSGTEEHPIAYTSAPGGRAVLTAAKRVPTERFKPWRDGILVADIADLNVRYPSEREIRGVGSMPVPVPEIFVDGERYVTADWPNAGEWSTFTNFVVRGIDRGTKSPTNKFGKAWSNGVFGYDGDRPARWTKAPYLWVHGYFKFDWGDNVLWMKKIDPEKRTIELGNRATYGLGPGNPSPRRWRAIHLLEELDAPGEYYVDFFGKKLYLMPKRPFDAKTRVEITSGANLLMRLTGVRHVSVRDLMFRCANNGIEGKGCSHLTFEKLRIENIRGDGLSVWSADHVLVKTCDFVGLGGRCLSLSGGDRKTLVSAGNRVTDCTLGPAGLLKRTGCAGFRTTGVGTVFDHNFVHDMPHHAISTGWEGANDCIFAYNVISNCCNESDDAAAFYKGRNPSCCGNVLDHNVFVDCGQRGKHGTMAVYFDDGDCGDTVTSNLFIRCGNKPYKKAKFTHGALFFNGGYAFTTVGNVFIDCQAGSRTSGADGWATDDWWRKHLKGLEKRLTEEVCVTGAVYTARYPWLATLLPGLPDGVRTNYLKGCTFINVKVPTTGRSHCLSDCRFLDKDDGTRPAGIEKAGVLTRRCNGE